MPVRPVRPAVACAVSALALLAGGCSAKRFENPNLVAGKQIFVAKCGSCHQLARAGTKGIIGPNLDDAFRDSLQVGLRRSTVETVVHGQINNPNPGGAMPRGLVNSGAQVNDIAAYVSYAVDNPGQDSGALAAAVRPAGFGKPAVESGGALEIDADPSGQLAYTTKQASATAGSVAISMKNASPTQHNIAIQTGTGASGAIVGAGPIVANGGVSSLHVTLKPGTYTFFCQVPGHRAAGMYGTLTVK